MKTVIAIHSAKTVFETAFMAKPMPVRTWPSAITRRASKRIVTPVSGSSASTMSTPFQPSSRPNTLSGARCQPSTSSVSARRMMCSEYVEPNCEKTSAPQNAAIHSA